MAATGGFFFTNLAYIDENNKAVLYKEGAFSSTESKPTGTAAADIASGSIIVEPDTGKVFFYDKKAGNWVEQFSFKS